MIFYRKLLFYKQKTDSNYQVSLMPNHVLSFNDGYQKKVNPEICFVKYELKYNCSTGN